MARLFFALTGPPVELARLHGPGDARRSGVTHGL